MKKIFSKTAYTLIELIVSLMLASVVILGIYSVQEVLNSNNQDYGQRYLVRSETQLTLNHILNNASLAVGDGASTNGMLDLSILAGAGVPPGVNDANSFCMHQAGTGDTPPGQNIINSAADIWLCYTWSPATYQIYYCTMSFNAGASPYRGAAAPCTSSSANYTFLGTAYSAPTIAFVGSTGSFTVTLTNCLSNAAGSCSSTGTSTDQINNPEVQISGSVFPGQEGTG